MDVTPLNMTAAVCAALTHRCVPMTAARYQALMHSFVIGVIGGLYQALTARLL